MGKKKHNAFDMGMEFGIKMVNSGLSLNSKKALPLGSFGFTGLSLCVARDGYNEGKKLAEQEKAAKELAKELAEEKETSDVRVKSLEKQEKIVREKLIALQNKLVQSQAARSGVAIPGTTTK